MKRTLQCLGMLVCFLMSWASAQAVTIYYNNPDNWSQPKAYVYYLNEKNGTWPGVNMTKVSAESSLWKIDVTGELAKGNIIFTDGSNQYPASGEEGLPIGEESMISLGHNIWTKYEAAAFNVYFDNSGKKWATPHVHYWGASGSEWPGVEMTQVEETTVWKYTVPAGTGGVIFTDGAQPTAQQTGDFAAKADHRYDATSDKGVYVEPANMGDPFYVYFDNTTARWATPYIHYWGGKTATEFPGVAMQQVSGNANIYRYQVAAGTTGCLFNGGGTPAEAQTTQTQDMQVVADNIYNQNGKIGLYTDAYVPEVEKPDALYIVGDVNGTAWGTTTGVTMTKSGNKFVATDVVINPFKVGADKGYFTFVTKVGASWDDVNGGDRYGAMAENTPMTNGVAADVAKYVEGQNASSAKSWELAVGTYTIEMDFETMKVTATLSGTGPDVATGNVIVRPLTLQPNKSGNLQINLSTDIPMVAMQLDVTLPDVVSTIGTPVLSDMMVGHVLDSETVGKTVKAVIYSPNNSVFSRLEGALIYIPITIAADAELGEYTVNVSNIAGSDQNLNPAQIATTATGTLTISAVTVDAVTLNKTTLSLQVGESETLVATVTPEDAANKTVTWKSANAAIATVDSNGTVTGVAKGTTTITATCGDLEATCTVAVGKSDQTITWDQTFSSMQVGEEVELTATASSELAVSYVITNGTSYAEIVEKDGKTYLKANAKGVVTIQAQQLGNETYAPATPISKVVPIELNYIQGDANNDDQVTIADATTAISFMLGRTLTESQWNFAAADMDGNNVINVIDVTRIIQVVVGPKNASRNEAKALYDESSAIEEFEMSVDSYGLRISFSNQEEYIATQFDVTLPNGVEVDGYRIGGSSHIVAYRQYDNVVRVAVYSHENHNFAPDGYISLFLNANPDGDITISNALLNATNGGDILETSAKGVTVNHSSGVEMLGINSDAQISVYSVDGVRVFEGKASDFSASRSGVYIVREGNNAKKMMIRK